MDSLITQVIAWPTLLVALMMFGFAPGAVLRLIVLAFRRDDPRRIELLAELPHVPRIERSFWVCEQLEVALFEGLLRRLAGPAGVWGATTTALGVVAQCDPEECPARMARGQGDASNFRTDWLLSCLPWHPR